MHPAQSDLFSAASEGLSLGLSAPLTSKRYGRWRLTRSVAACCARIGRKRRSIETSASSDARTSPPSTSSAAVLPAKTSARPARELALRVLEAASSSNTSASSMNSGPSGSSSRMWPAVLRAGSTLSRGSWSGSAMKSYRSRLRRVLLAHPMSADASFLLPTLTANDYGSTNNGTRDGETTYATAGKASLSTLSRSGQLLPTLTVHGNYANGEMSEHGGDGLATALARLGHAGPLSPIFCEWFMGFPIGWTAWRPLETPLFPNAPK